MKLSVIVPVFNEESTISLALEQLFKCDFVAQVVVVNDGSNDATRSIIELISESEARLTVINLEVNRGKGSAIRTGLKHCQEEIVAIQDADLEYDPRELDGMLALVRENDADVVYGSRFRGAKPGRAIFIWHRMGNKLLTDLTNVFVNLNLTDMETCQKLFRKSLLEGVVLKENRFGIEPELTIKFARLGARIFEVGVSYRGRTYKEGKKITWRDGFSAIWCIFKYSLQPRRLWIDEHSGI